MQPSEGQITEISLPSFAGDATQRISFWDSFASAIHDNNYLNDIDKFQYLRSCLQGSAAETVAGLQLTSANYKEAVKLLQARFANKQIIISKHIDTLMELNQISKSEDIGALRLLYDRVEAIRAKPTRNWSPSWHVRDISNANNYHRKPILYVYLIGFLWYHGVERNISKCMGWNQLWRYLGEYWNKLNFTCLICSWSLSWSLVAISSHFNRF